LKERGQSVKPIHAARLAISALVVMTVAAVAAGVIARLIPNSSVREYITPLCICTALMAPIVDRLWKRAKSI
jgi:hypothetical protein